MVEPKIYVNGAMLAENFGKTVCAIGKITAMNPSMMGFQMDLPDNRNVKVTLEEQLEEPIEGFVQMIARVNRDSSLTAEHLVSFGIGEIDLDTLNKTINVMSRFPEYFSPRAEMF